MRRRWHNEDPVAPRRQSNWDWRAAANFIAGGSGGALLLWASWVAMPGVQLQILTCAGLALVGIGLTCVWFEIGRPWRALNTFRHGASSWMTREAMLALPLFASGSLTLWSGQRLPALVTGAIGLTFVFAQASILRANIGIPAWRHPRCPPLVIATALAEGAGLLLCASWAYPQLLAASFPLALLIALRQAAWQRYLGALRKNAAPTTTIRALQRVDGQLRWAGSIVPFVLAPAAGLSGMTALAVTAGALAALAGWRVKYALICEAAYTQGFALPKLPVRGRGTPGPAVRPGWEESKQGADA
jgi:phenylacetyl-CoA:acceptor oxidoreductase subunit 2